MRSKFKWIFTLLLALTMQFSFAQEKTITGIVSDASGPIPGVNVAVKGTKKGVSTGFDGKYSIKAKEGETLVFSFMGMREVSKVVGVSNTINTTMQDDSKTLGEVVVTAVNTKKRKGAITSTFQEVKGDEINRAAAPTVLQGLSGKASGLQINNTSSSVNGEYRVVFRGARTITGNNQALVVIDGAISSIATLQQLPPDIVLSTTLLKGAQGAALYGSDGVNGVIVVNTKKGGSEKLSLNIKSSIDITDIAYLPQTQQRYGQGWDGLHAAQENGSWGPEFDGSMQPVGLMQPDGSFITAPYSPIKDNIKQFFKTGTIMQNGITLSGGTLEKGYANLSINNQTSEFIVDGDQLKRNSFLFKAGKEFGKFSVEGNLNYINQNVQETASGLYANLLQTAANIPVSRFENVGNDNHWTTYFLNPYWEKNNKRRDRESDNFTGIINLGYKINKNFNISYLANLRMVSSNSSAYNNAYKDNAGAIYGSRSKDVLAEFVTNNEFTRNFYGDLILNYDFDLGHNLSLKGLVGNNIQDRFYKITEAGGQNFAIAGIYNINNVINPYSATQRTLFDDVLQNGIEKRRKIGVFGEATLGYNDYLFLNVTARNDWSSLFNANNNSFFYPSIGLSFLPTKAFEAITAGNILNYAKAYVNYTKVGNDSAVGIYNINRTGSLGIGYPFNGANSYIQPTAITDPFIRPEMVITKEAGLALGLFKDRITLEGSAYITDTNDLITVQSLGGSTGLSSIRRNIGNMQTRGYEIDFGFTPIKSKNADGFEWTNKINFTQYKTIVNKVTDDSKSVSLRQPFGFVGIFAEEGEEFPLIKGSTYLRDDYGRVIVDNTGMPTIDPTLRKLGKATPDYILGLTTSFSYKGLKLSATMDYRTGHKFFSQTKRDLAWTGRLVESAENRSGFILPNSSFDYNNNGTIESNESNSTVVTGGNNISQFISYYDLYAQTGENLVLDATAFKIREASLSYTFSKKLLNKTGVNNLTIGVNVRNPLSIFSKQNRNYNDPETSETTGNASGLAFTDRYPAMRSLGFSLNASF